MQYIPLLRTNGRARLQLSWWLSHSLSHAATHSIRTMLGLASPAATPLEGMICWPGSFAE